MTKPQSNKKVIRLKKVSSIIAVFLLIVVILGSVPSVIASSTSNLSTSPTTLNWVHKVDRRLLSDDTYKSNVHLPFIPSNLSSKLSTLKSKFSKELVNPTQGKARVLILYKGGKDVASYIKQNAMVYSGFSEGNGGIMMAWVTKQQVQKLAMNPNIISISLQSSIQIGAPKDPDTLKQPNSLKELGLTVSEGEGSGYNLEMAPEITGATYAWSHGYNGTGVNVAVVDTGVDMGESDLGLQALARDQYGLPLLFDADEMGTALTINPTNVSGNNITVIPLNVPSSDNKTYNGVVFYDPATGSLEVTNYSLVAVVTPNNFSFSAIPVVNQSFTLPSDVNTSTPIHFGLVSQYYLVGSSLIWILAPAITTDTNGDGQYDTVYIDLSSIYYMLMDSLYNVGIASTPPNSSLLDFSFADEPGISYGHEIAARDFNGDGVNDLSMGALSQAFNDANGVFYYAYNFGWFNDYEWNGLILPGLDTYDGEWFDLVYDFYGHGTECAHVIASRGQIPRPTAGPFGTYTELKYIGIAPGAKIGAAPALWIGNVITAELWLSGYDLANPEYFSWMYTGIHQADVISNSWGMSYLLLNGFASDGDVMSLFEDFITLSTGTVIVHAAGNGGPGFGSVTIPGAATNVITVGASNLFYYRPIFGYMPGGYYQVVSWSDRGPTQYGYPKPDVVNIGSFEYSVARVIDGLGDGTMNLDLFGGTSEATPMTAGAVAIIIQALMDNIIHPPLPPPTPITLQAAETNLLQKLGSDSLGNSNGNSINTAQESSFIKVLLKSTASDMGYDPFSQGSGHVNITKAIQFIEEGKGVLAYSSDSVSNIATLFDETMGQLLGTSTEWVDQFLSNSFDTSLYFGVIKPGASKTMNLNLLSPRSSKDVSVKAVYLRKRYGMPVWRLIDTRMSQIYIPGQGFVPFGRPYAWISGSHLYLDLAKLPPGSRLLLAFRPIFGKILNADLARITISYPYNVMDPYGRNGNYSSMVYMGAELSYWVDFTRDNKVEPYETGRIQYDIREGNTYQIQVGNLQEAFQITRNNILSFLYNEFGIDASSATSAPIIDYRIFSNNYYNEENRGHNVVSVSGTIELYNKYTWRWIHVAREASAPGSLDVTATVPRSAKPGVYEGYLEISDGTSTTMVPISIAVPAIVDMRHTRVTIRPHYSREFYNNYNYINALDQSWRPEVGDWRTFPVLIDNGYARLGALEVSVSWRNPTSSFDIGVLGSGYNYLATWFYGGYPEWVDSSVLALKDSISLTGAVYDYFDWPSTTKASVIAPIGPTPLDNYDNSYLLYWVVVHQVFSATGMDQPTIQLNAYRSYSNNLVSVRQGSAVTKNSFVYTGNMGEVEVDNYGVIVLPLDGATGTITVNATLFRQFHTVSWIKTVVNASDDAHGRFLVMIPIYGTNPSIIWGNEAGGDQYVFLYANSIMYMMLIVNVR